MRRISRKRPSRSRMAEEAACGEEGIGNFQFSGNG
jgi:hypothetical protein